MTRPLSSSIPPTPISRGFHRNRNIGIAAFLVTVIVIVGLYAAGVFTGGRSIFGPPFDFELSVTPAGGTVMQGKSIQTSVSIALSSGSPEQVTLSASGGPNGVTYNFETPKGSPDFTSTLTVSVPDSVPTSAYSFTVTATGGGKTYSTSYTLSVLSAKVTVSGTITTIGLGTHPSGIKFVNTETGLTYTGALNGNSYSITLQNQQAYAVTCSWQGLLWSTGEFSGGTLTVDAGVGTTMMIQDFSG